MSNFPNWLEADYQNLAKQYTHSTLPHGLMMVGRIGNGSREASLRLIAALMCIAPIHGDACSTCKSCQLLASGSHPDYLKVEPEGKSQTIKVDAIRQLTHLVSETAQQSGNKVVFIQNAEKMNLNAANALLKVLEEPTQNTFLLMEVEELSRILPTVRSRSRIVRLNGPQPQESLDWMALQGVTKEDASRKLAMCFGLPFSALTLSNEAEAAWLERETTFLRPSSFTTLGKFINSQSLPELLEQVLYWVDESLRQRQTTKSDNTGVSESMLQELNKVPSILLFKFRDYIVGMLTSVKNQANLNTQLMSEQIAARWLKMRGLI
ncbi:DNA polymerase III subunit delta' [Reinekea forsetii]|nr:DNA polymerase III subunit delta' [Reinekea forsetii]